MGFELIVAFVAGLVSFISPCVLPLLPAYIGYMGGRVTNTVSAQIQPDGSLAATRTFSIRFSTFLHGIAFVLGFTFIFVILGVAGRVIVSTFGGTDVLGRVGGVLIIFFGLHFMGALSWLFNRLRQVDGLLNNPLFSAGVAMFGIALISWMFTGTLIIWNTEAYTVALGIMALAFIALFLLGMVLGGAFVEPYAFWDNLLTRLEYMLYSDTRPQDAASGKEGLMGSAFMGVVFAAGWSPCIGPTLGAALTLAANNPTGAELTEAAATMTAYSLGLGIPFLLAALMLDSAQGGLRRLNRHMDKIKLVSGTFLILIGYLVASNSLQALSQDFSTQFLDTSVRVENCVVGWVEGDVKFGQIRGCLSDDPDFYTLVALNEGRLTQEEVDAGITAAELESREQEAETSSEAAEEEDDGDE